jgi:hypothetical protein
MTTKLVQQVNGCVNCQGTGGALSQFEIVGVEWVQKVYGRVALCAPQQLPINRVALTRPPPIHHRLHFNKHGAAVETSRHSLIERMQQCRR